MSISIKRIMKDLDILAKNKEELKKRGIYFHFNDNDMSIMKILIIPRPKSEGALISPYTYGNFLFEIKFGEDYPLSPPKLTFHPKQSFCRLHPNYYQCGKVCLSVINTWAGNDWSPSTSILCLINILEERFNENAICFEPGREMASVHRKTEYNNAVEYAKYYTTILKIKTYDVFNDFHDIIREELRVNIDHLLERAKTLCSENVQKTTMNDTYFHNFVVDYPYIVNALTNVRAELQSS